MSFRSWLVVLLMLSVAMYGVQNGYISFHCPPLASNQPSSYFRSLLPSFQKTPEAASPAVAPIADAPANPPSRQAPPGYFFLLERTSVASDSGVYGIAAGTKLALLGRKPGQLHLTDGQVNLWLPESAVTSDLTIAELTQNTDARSQAEVRALLAQHKAQAEKNEAEALERQRAAAEQQLKMEMSRAAATPAPKNYLNPLDRGSYNQTYSRPWYPYYRRYYYDRWGNRYYTDPNGRWIYY